MADHAAGDTEAALAALRNDAATCTACDLYRAATQTVFGDGAVPAALMLVGEQPGDKEDLAGEPFVGPAGRILDEALERAGIPCRDIYVTNAVKHFKFEQRGKVRLHKRLRAPEGQDRVQLLDELVIDLGAAKAAVYGAPR